MPSKDWEEALCRIREVKEKRLTKLDLFKLSIEKIPGEVGELDWLVELRCGCDGRQEKKSPLSDLSPLAGLSGLQSLHCSGTQVNNLSPLAGLAGLQELNCSGTQVNDLNPLASLSGLWYLDCGSTQVSDLSPLTGLSGLGWLDCWSTQVNNLSPLVRLSRLWYLNCGWTQVSDLSPLAELCDLHMLHCGNTQVSDLSPLVGLSGLQHLICEHTQVSDLSPLAGLNGLQLLYCGSTQISDLSPLASLSCLQNLYCGYTQVSDLSPILPALYEGRLAELYAYSIPLRGIPRELMLMENTRFNSAPGLREYLLDLEKDGAENRELKVLFVGNGRVGKTTLSHFLRHGKPPASDIESTHGIIIEEFDLEVPNHDPLRLKLWDFGGQEIYHATHRLFLKQNAVYILLWTSEPQDTPDEPFHPVSYWVEYIRELAGEDAAILLVKNKADIYPGNDLPPDWEEVRGQVETNPLTISAVSGEGLETLKGRLRDAALLIKDWFSYKLPRSWINTREDMERLCGQGHKDIPKAHFEQLCLKNKVIGKETLLQYLHATGFLFHKEGHFRDRIILDQNWAVDAVYRIFDKREGGMRREIEQRRGEFDGRFTKRIWPNNSREEREVFMGFILSCRICFEKDRDWLESFEGREFVAPALLPAEPPVGCLGQPWDLFLEFQYPILHRTFIERFIAETAPLADRAQWWRQGIILESQELGAVAMVEARPPEKTICVLARGDVLGRLRLLRRVANKLREIHGDRRATVHGSDNGRDFFTQDEVEAGRRQGWNQLRTRDGRQVAVDPQKLAWMIETNKTIESDEEETFAKPATTPRQRLKVFISYAHEDETYKKELEKVLKVIDRQHDALEVWSDRQMFAGDQVEEAILERLEQADIVCMLISRDFMASDYCFTKEMAEALRKYEEGSGIPVSIIIRPTPDWHGHGIGRHLALPFDGKPMEDWKSPDSFWADVQKELSRLVERELGVRAKQSLCKIG